jgi:23S rRNA pseudouridine1911/1915/1917 synthase
VTVFVVSEDAAGRRLDLLVAETLGTSRSQAAALIADGAVTVDGRRAAKSDTPRAGQRVEVADRLEPEPVPPPPAPPILYRDDDLVVVDKPAGLVVHTGAGHRGDTLVDALLATGIPLVGGRDPDRPGVVHRLDRDTSGLMVLACSERAHEALVGALGRREVERRYRTLVVGTPTPSKGTIDGPIGRDPRERTRFAVVAGGKPAVTHYAVEATARIDTAAGAQAVSALWCRLETGRTHQIRVHLAALGHGIVGDRVYGRAGAEAAALGLERPALHAASLAFRHPVDGRDRRFEAALPDDLAGAWARIVAPEAPEG